MVVKRARSLRNSAKALIVEQGKMLVISKRDSEGVWYLLPGGGQQAGENLHETLKRECLEEIGVEIEIGPLCHVREYIGLHHEFAEEDAHVHQVEFLFRCEIKEGSLPQIGHLPDNDQLGVEWLSLAELDRYRLYPQILKRLLREQDLAPTYLGDVN